MTDSIWVQVDSLPDLSIMADPEKDSYCEGEEVTLTSTTYEPANFPDIDFMWANNLPGTQTPDSFLNLVFIAQEDSLLCQDIYQQMPVALLIQFSLKLYRWHRLV